MTPSDILKWFVSMIWPTLNQTKTTNKKARYKHILTITSIFTGLLVSRKLFWKAYNKHRKYPDGPIGIPFFGVLFSYIRNPYQWFHHNSIKYGAIMSASIGVQHNIYINDIGLAKQLLMSKRKIVNHRPTKFAGRDTTSCYVF